MPPEIDNRISASELREAIKSLKPVLGYGFANIIIHDLEVYGLLAPSQNESLTFELIHNALERIFGEGAHVLMRLIVKALIENKADT